MLWAALLPILLAAPVPGVLAQTEKTPQELRTADDEFSRQLSELKRTFADLSKKFEDSAQTIDRLSDAQSARKEIEELRDDIGKLLGAVADNGTVWSLGSKALSHADESSSRSSRKRGTSRRTGSS